MVRASLEGVVELSKLWGRGVKITLLTLIYELLLCQMCAKILGKKKDIGLFITLVPKVLQ